MPSYNLYHGIGYLGQDPKVKITSDGTKIVNFSVAIHEKIKDQEKTLWINLVCFNGLADLAEQYLHKGSCVLFSGPLETEEWETEGKNRFSLKVRVRELRFIDSKDREEELAAASNQNLGYPNQ